jgi:hypothetical protein
MSDLEGTEPPSARPPFISPFVPENVSVTAEDTYSGHVVSDDQLDRLEKGGTDQSIGWAQCLLGGGIGLFQNVIALIRSLWLERVPEWHDALLALACVACFAGAVALMYGTRNRASDVTLMCKRIRDRKKRLN